jgi:hypothetical protein
VAEVDLVNRKENRYFRRVAQGRYLSIPDPARPLLYRRAPDLSCAAQDAPRTMKSREEQLSWAKQRAFICVDMGGFSEAVAGLRAGLAENPLTKGVVSSEHACADTKRRWMRRSAGVRKR